MSTESDIPNIIEAITPFLPKGVVEDINTMAKRAAKEDIPISVETNIEIIKMISSFYNRSKIF